MADKKSKAHIISKRDYMKALKIVGAYESQVNTTVIKKDGRFGFLWYNVNGDGSQRWVKAKSIDSAIKKFIRNAPKTMDRLDYEVQHNNSYIDVSEKEELVKWI